jgi:hypothetical protein
MKGKLTEVDVTFMDGHKEPFPHIESHCCDNCEKPLPKTYTPGEGGIQPDDALQIEFTPYYGGYFDQGGPEDMMEDRAYRYFWFCQECADKLIKEFPCLTIRR